MQEARNILEFDPTRRSVGGHQRLLDDCGELAANRLAEDYAQALNVLRQELHRRAANTHVHDTSLLYLQGMELLRDHADAIGIAFRQGLFAAYKQACRKALMQSQASVQAPAALSLVEADELEQTLAVSNLAHALHNACGEELFGLNQRLGLLLMCAN
ncbi:MAG: DUF1631 family protein [Burkholderiales bacterium]|nr:DUF1631 family protein [Burkholderiales bacterium]